MALPAPSDAERLSLREYRISTIPTKRSQQQQQQRISEQQKQSPSPSPSQKSSLTSLCISNDLVHPRSQQSNNHHHKHSTYGGHHHPHHRRHKNPSSSLELSAEELGKMLNLVSELDYLRLVSPMNAIIEENHDGNSDNSPGERKKDSARHDQDSGLINNENTSASSETLTVTRGSQNRSCLELVRNFEPHIFEKVDYIKRIRLRRKTFKKLRKARNNKPIVSLSDTT